MFSLENPYDPIGDILRVLDNAIVDNEALLRQSPEPSEREETHRRIENYQSIKEFISRVKEKAVGGGNMEIKVNSLAELEVLEKALVGMPLPEMIAAVERQKNKLLTDAVRGDVAALGGTITADGKFRI